jgi:hypothetical protein
LYYDKTPPEYHATFKKMRLVRLPSTHRDTLTPIIDRMKIVGRATGDPVYNSILAAKHSLQAAISALPDRPRANDVRPVQDQQTPAWRKV